MIKLFSDMGADIPVEIAKKYKIRIFNMVVTDGENEYILNYDIDKYKLFENKLLRYHIKIFMILLRKKF